MTRIIDPNKARYAGVDLVADQISLCLTQGVEANTVNVSVACAGDGGGYDPPSTGKLYLSSGTHSIEIGMYLTAYKYQADPDGRKKYILSLADQRKQLEYNFRNVDFNSVLFSDKTERKKAARKNDNIKNLCEIIADLLGSDKNDIEWHNTDRYLEDVYYQVKESGRAKDILDGVLRANNLVLSLSLDGTYHISQPDQSFEIDYEYFSEFELTYANQCKPRYVSIMGNKIVNETWFKEFIPVGLDLDGSIKPISQLSYAPKSKYNLKYNTDKNYVGVWAESGPQDAFAAMSKDNKSNYIPLAQRCIFKWFKIKFADSAEQQTYLPLLDELSSTGYSSFTERNSGNEIIHLKPYVLTQRSEFDGISWYDLKIESNQEFLSADKQSDFKSFYKQGFQIDGEHGIIKFDDAIFTRTEDKAYGVSLSAPTIWLRGSYESNTGSIDDFAHYDIRLNNASIDGHDIIQIQDCTLYQRDGKSINESEVNSKLKKYASEVKNRFNTKRLESVTVGILNTDYDAPYGQLKSITWSMDMSCGAKTHFCYGTEDLTNYVTNYQQRKNNDDLANKIFDSTKRVIDNRANGIY
jgi:hypothetical protein